MKIPTATEWIKKCAKKGNMTAEQKLIGFAKLHRKAILKSAAKQVKMIKDLGENEKGQFISKQITAYNDEEGYPVYPDKQSILKSYPESNIK